MKSYELKLYSRLGVFKKQINPQDVSSEIAFQEELDGGQGDLTLKVVGSQSDYVVSDIIEIREVNDDSPTVSQTYTGIIEEIETTEYEYTTLLDIKLLGVFTALNDVLFKSGGSRTFSKTGTAGAIISDIVASFNSDYGAMFGDTQNIQIFIRYWDDTETWNDLDFWNEGGPNLINLGEINQGGATLTLNFDNENCLSAIKKVLEGTAFHFFIGAGGIINVFESFGNQVLTLGNEVIEIKNSVHKKDMYNTLFLARNGGTEVTYTSAGAVTTYGKKEKRESDSDIVNLTTQNSKGNRMIDDYSLPRNEISMKTKQFQTNVITPGKLLTVQNTNLSIVNQQITKIQKGLDWTIYVGDFVSFGSTVKK